MPSGYVPAFQRNEASNWRRIRKYAVPRSMIERATERRLAGDWRGACAAADVDVRVDLARVRRRHGAESAARLEEDLRHLVPDLLRWHLPRYLHGHTTLLPGQDVLLASYGVLARAGLFVRTPGTAGGPQRLTLDFRDFRDTYRGQWREWRFARHLWDARQAGELLKHCGGGTRMPFRNADGTPRGTDELPTRDPGPGDPAGHAEWITMLHDRGEIEQACAAAGITVECGQPSRRPGDKRAPHELPEALARLPVALAMLERQARRLAATGLGNRFVIAAASRPLLVELEGGACRLSLNEAPWGTPRFPEALWRRLPDLDLLRLGSIGPKRLHPLVSASLFPERVPTRADGPARVDGWAPPPVRVRCQGEWHEVQAFADGRLRIPHPEEDRRRERALRALGGPPGGCFAVAQAWASGSGQMPSELWGQRHELFLRVLHGDAPEVLRMHQAGFHPRSPRRGRPSR